MVTKARKIVLETITLSKEDQIGPEKEFSDSKSLVDLLRVKSEGMDLEHMHERLELIQKVKKAGDAEHVIVTEREFELLSGLVKNNKWPVAHEAIYRLCQNVINAEETVLVEAAKD